MYFCCSIVNGFDGRLFYFNNIQFRWNSTRLILVSRKMFAYSVLALKSPYSDIRCCRPSTGDIFLFQMHFFVCWFKRNIFPLAFNSFIFISSLYKILHHCAACRPAIFSYYFALEFRYMPLIVADLIPAIQWPSKPAILTCRMSNQTFKLRNWRWPMFTMLGSVASRTSNDVYLMNLFATFVCASRFFFFFIYLPFSSIHFNHQFRESCMHKFFHVLHW